MCATKVRAVAGPHAALHGQELAGSTAVTGEPVET